MSGLRSLFFSDDVPLPDHTGIVADVSVSSRNCVYGTEGGTIDPSVLEQPAALQHYNEHSIGDEDLSSALPSSLSSFFDPNFGEEDSLLRDSDLDFVNLEAAQQFSPTSSSSNIPTPSISATIFPQSFHDQTQSFSAASTQRPVARDNTTSTRLSLATRTDLPSAKKQILRSTTFLCDICDHESGTAKAHERHKSKHSYQCEVAGCNKTYTTSTNRQRHYDTVHKKDKFYYCRCGKEDSRKDNHRRHIQSCEKGKGNHYCCSCGILTTVKEEYLAHIATCGLRKNRASTNAAKAIATSRE